MELKKFGVVVELKMFGTLGSGIEKSVRSASILSGCWFWLLLVLLPSGRGCCCCVVCSLDVVAVLFSNTETQR